MAQYPHFNFNGARQAANPRPAPNPAPEPPKPSPPPPPEPSGVSAPPKGPLPLELQGLLSGMDGEKLALLALLYLLYKEGADLTLLLAIGYILL